MKKILSVALSTAMAFSMFASVAFGDTAVTPQQQFDALKAKDIFNGYPDGTAGLDKEMTRAEFAKVITKLLGLKEITGTLSYTDKNYNANNWAVPYIEAVTAAGIMEGTNVEKKLFSFNGKVTIQEMATILTRALDLEIPTETNNNAAAWAKGYVQAAINAGLIDANANFAGNASRELLVGAAYSIDQAQSLKVESYTVTEAGKVVEFKISDGETVKVTLDTALEANKETEVKFTYKDKEFTEKVTYVVTAATKVEKVTANNLKEILVTFDGDLKEEEAEKITNYKLDDATLNAASTATLQADKKSVLISLNNDGPTLTNQRTYKLTVSGFSNITAATFDFSALDVTVPEVSSVEVLGNKVINVKFSEPVKVASAETRLNYKIDGFVTNGEIKLAKDGKTATITLYSRLKAGAHKISISGVQDYANMTIINYLDKDITVAEDTTAPASFTVESATLDAATVKFNEAVDQDTVKAANIYWSDNAGTTKHVATSVEATDSTFTTYKIIFDSNKLPARDTTLYVESVSDLFGNAASKLSTTVNATVDVTRPEISSLQPATDQYGNFTTDSVRKLDVKFNKSIATSQFSVSNSNNLVVKNSKGEIVSVAAGAVTKANATNTLTVTLSNALTEGTAYTVEVKNVVDNTALNNKIIPQTFTITAPQVSAPSVSNVAVSQNTTEGTKVQVVFNKSMALDGEYSILKSDRYMVKVGGTGSTGGSWYLLPTGTTFQPTYDNKGVIINVPADAKYDGQNLLSGANITGFKVTLVSDVNGNKLSGLTKEVFVGDAAWGSTAAKIETSEVKATAKNKVKVVLDRPLQVVYASDFRVDGVQPTSASYETVDGKGEVTLTLASDLPAAVNVKLTTVAADDIRSLDLLGNKIAPAAVAGITVKDGVAPELIATQPVVATANNKIQIKFNEELTTTLTQAQIAANFVVKTGLNQDTTLNPGVDYTAVILPSNESIVELTITKPLADAQKVTVATNDNAVYIFDKQGVATSGYAGANKIKFSATDVANVSALNVLAPEADATVTSTVYTVNSTANTITDVAFATTVAQLTTNLTEKTGASVEVVKADDSSTIGADTVVSGFKVKVESSNGATKTYTVTVDAASTTATVSVKAGATGYAVTGNTVTVPVGDTVADVRAALEASTGANFVVTDASNVAKINTDTVVATDKIVVTAQDTSVTKTYTVAN
ncbi:Ig-like domain-containing protein [Paenibacillus sp. FSL H8-0079]|uniref:Ig-like domain-containing protein n=1 Tax=Paenibacillus sp. FSL H8-0079 TaxID=2921375 RepID=UPI0030EE1625